MKLYRIVVGPIQENCYLIKNEETGEGIIIDPGDEALKIMEAVKKAGIKKITAIFITHGHGDHISALEADRGQGLYEPRRRAYASRLEQQPVVFDRPG